MKPRVKVSEDNILDPNFQVSSSDQNEHPVTFQNMIFKVDQLKVPNICPVKGIMPGHQVGTRMDS